MRPGVNEGLGGGWGEIVPDGQRQGRPHKWWGGRGAPWGGARPWLALQSEGLGGRDGPRFRDHPGCRVGSGE